jgi:hypothetical protein
MSSSKFIQTLRKRSIKYGDNFKKLKIEMLKTIDYLEYHSYYEEDVRMFYDIIQYHMNEVIIFPGQFIVG